MLEQLAGDAGGDFRAVAEAEHVLMDDQGAAGLADAAGDGLPIARRQRPEIEDLD
jgi:hypothetical protein